MAFVWIVAARAGAFSGAPMGPPIAMLEEGRWAFGAEYGYGRADLEAYGLSRLRPYLGAPTSAYERLDIDNLTTHMLFGTLAYGVTDNWDLFLRLGLADGRDDMTVRAASAGAAPTGLSYNGGHGLAYGLGTRATVGRWGPWTFGGLAQVTWLNPDADDVIERNLRTGDTVATSRVRLDGWHTQVALAAAYQIDTFHFWMGPFLQFTEGSYERKGRTYLGRIPTGTFRSSGDLEEAAQVGIHGGATWEASERFRYQMEGQCSADSWLWGLSLVITPQRRSMGL